MCLPIQHFPGLGRIAGGDDVQHAFREASFGGEFSKDDPRQRRVGSRLENDGAAGEQRGNHFFGIDVEREIPGRYGRGNADSFIVGGALAGTERGFPDAVVFLPRHIRVDLHEVAPAVQAVGNLGPVDGHERGAHFVPGNGDQPLPVGFEQVVELLHEREALCVIGGPVGRVERPAGGNNRFLDVAGGRIGSDTDGLAGPGTDIVVSPVILRAAKNAVDIEQSFRKNDGIGIRQGRHVSFPNLLLCH